MRVDIKKHCLTNQTALLALAEREGFEPSVRYHRTHDFQSCSLSRSDTSPRRVTYFNSIRESK